MWYRPQVIDLELLDRVSSSKGTEELKDELRKQVRAWAEGRRRGGGRAGVGVGAGGGRLHRRRAVPIRALNGQGGPVPLR